jgi:hypothetical protein
VIPADKNTTTTYRNFFWNMANTPKIMQIPMHKSGGNRVKYWIIIPTTKAHSSSAAIRFIIAPL